MEEEDNRESDEDEITSEIRLRSRSEKGKDLPEVSIGEATNFSSGCIGGRGAKRKRGERKNKVKMQKKISPQTNEKLTA